MGLSAAKGLACTWNCPFVGVNHVEAHLYAAMMADLGRKLAMPILVLWGKCSSVGKRFADPLGLWRQRAEDVRGEALPSGHYVNEEAPEQVLAWFLRFFVG